MQRLVKCLSQVLGNAIDAAIMVVHDSWFAILVSAHLCIGTDYILRKRLKELVARNFRTTVNNRLNEKFFISRECLLC